VLGVRVRDKGRGGEVKGWGRKVMGKGREGKRREGGKRRGSSHAFCFSNLGSSVGMGSLFLAENLQCL